MTVDLNSNNVWDITEFMISDRVYVKKETCGHKGYFIKQVGVIFVSCLELFDGGLLHLSGMMEFGTGITCLLWVAFDLLNSSSSLSYIVQDVEFYSHWNVSELKQFIQL